MNLLHLAYDEKFIDFIADVFATCPNANSRYRIIVDDASAPLEHVSHRVGTETVGEGYPDSVRMVEDFAWCDALIVHYLTLAGAKLILRAPKGVRIAWSGWGLDYYAFLPNHDEVLLGSSTRRLLARMRPAEHTRSIVYRLRAALRQARQRLGPDRLIRRAIRRVEFFSAPVPGDFDVVRRIFGDTVRAEYAQISYGSVEQTFARGPATVTGDDVLVGNSASPTNNHADVFDELAKVDLGDRKVVVPLSYGGDPAYRDAVVAYGRELFGAQLDPLINFMHIERYNAVIARCSVAVMGHRRQQGLGTVGTMMQAGARVFIDRASPVYRHLTDRGAIISPLDELAQNDEALFSSLTPGEQRLNRDVLAAIWGQDVVERDAARFVDRLSARPDGLRA